MLFRQRQARGGKSVRQRDTSGTMPDYFASAPVCEPRSVIHICGRPPKARGAGRARRLLRGVNECHGRLNAATVLPLSRVRLRSSSPLCLATSSPAGSSGTIKGPISRAVRALPTNARHFTPSRRSCRHSCRRCRRDPPFCIADIVRDQNPTGTIDRDTDRPPARLSVIRNKAGQNILWRPLGTTVAKRNVDHLVSHWRVAIPAPVLANKEAASILGGRPHRVSQAEA
jgi:hypothetical protein